MTSQLQPAPLRPKVSRRERLPDPHKQPLEFLRVCLAGDERALALQRERQRAASEHLRTTLKTPVSETDDDFDLLRALDETRRAEGRAPLFPTDERPSL